MTNIQPLTSEEVLARQVKENAGTSSNRPALTAIVAETEHPPATSSQQKVSPVAEDTLKPKETGFNYRLPLGAYLLTFVYVQIFLGSLLVAAVTVFMYWQYTPGLNELWVLVNKEIWITMVVSGALSLFILSGSNVLRWCVVAASSVLSAIFAYHVFSLGSKLIGVDDATFGQAYFSSIMVVSVGLFVGGLLLCLVTVIYLLRKKVAAVYE